MNPLARLGQFFRRKSIDDIAWHDVDSGASPANAAVSVRAVDATSKSLNPNECYELSIAVNAAVNAIANNLSKGRFRHFFDTGREITGGPLWELTSFPGRSHKLTQKRFIRELVSWLNIAGEFAVNLIPGKDGWPVEMLPLAPHMLRVILPAKMPNTRADVVQWGYRWTDGSEERIRDDYLFYDRLFNPNPRSIRGLSPLVTGAVQVSGAYYAERYNKQFFENNAIPSHLLVLPDGVPRQQREQFERQYRAEFGKYTNNAHKVMVVAGKDVKMEALEQPFQDGAFMEMMKRGDLKVAQLYHVPAVNMGLYDKTRFDTANEERQLFCEETLDPQAELLGESFQSQVTNPFFLLATHTTGKPKLTRSMGERLEKAMSENGGRSITTIFDTDPLPIKHQVLLSKTESAKAMRETYNMSAQEVVDFIGLDLPNRKERDDVWIPNNYLNITHPEMNAALVPGVKPVGDGEKKPTAGADANAKAKLKKIEAMVRKLRRPTFDAVEAGEIWSLAEADALADDAALKPAVRKLRNGLRNAVKDDDRPVAAAKKYLNEIDCKTLI